MPELSEIQRAGDDISDDASQARVQGSPRAGLVNSEASKIEDYMNHDNCLTYVSIIAVIFGYDIPLVNSPRLPDLSKRSPPLFLGSGASSTVTIHETGPEAEAICAPGKAKAYLRLGFREMLSSPLGPGTLVALKRYTSASNDPGEIAASAKKLHRLIWQELQVFSHAFLRDHENICRLLFIGWEDDGLLPALALELGTYGTLANTLQQVRSYGSSLRKSHLTADVVVGLAALHGCGLVHGDIKTSNILIQDHPSREIVAKLADFAGVSPVASFGHGSHHGFGTPCWQPPEVLFNDEMIDWELADVYSLGMVIATMWTKEGFIPENGTFLDPELPYALDSTAKNMWIETIKSRDDTNPNSLVSIGKRVTVCSDPAPLPIESIISHTLPSHPQRRVNSRTLLDLDFMTFLRKVDRQISLPAADMQAPDAYEDDESHLRGIVGNDKYQQRTAEFRALALETMVTAATRILGQTELPNLPDLDYPYAGDEEDLISDLDDFNWQRQRLLYESNMLSGFQSLATQIYQSYLVGSGTKVDESAAAVWLRRAAMSGDTRAIQWYLPIEGSLKPQSQVKLPVPRRAWGAMSTLMNCERSAACLQELDPDVHALAVSAFRRLHWGRIHWEKLDKFSQFGGRMLNQTSRFSLTLNDIETRVRSDKGIVNESLPVIDPKYDLHETALHYCAATGELGFARFLVLEAGADINAVNLRNETPIFYATRAGQHNVAVFLLEQGADVTQISTEGIGLMHSLTRMDEDDATRLFPQFLDHGALINIKANETYAKVSDTFTVGEGLPVSWAAQKHRQSLFCDLIEAYKQERLDRGDLEKLLDHLAGLNLTEMLDRTLQAAGDLVRLGPSETLDVDSVQGKLADLSVDTKKPSTTPRSTSILNINFVVSLFVSAVRTESSCCIELRYIHGKQFRLARKSTIKTLLSQVTKRINEVDEPSTLIRGLLDASMVLGDEITLPPCIEGLEQEGIDVVPLLTQAGPSEIGALAFSIYQEQYDNFSFLLDKYPSLINITGPDGASALHAAVQQTTTQYAKLLLERGADRYMPEKNGNNSFITALMAGPSLEMADLLAENANMDLLLAPNPVSGFTTFGSVLAAVTDRASRITGDINRLKYVVEKLGHPSIWVSIEEDCSVFEWFLGAIARTSSADQSRSEIQVFKYLVQLFRERIGDISSTGLSALHVAVLLSNVDAARILLENQASVNILTTPGSVQNVRTGITPLELAIKIKNESPHKRYTESLMDLRARQEKSQELVILLCQYGGECGRNPEPQVMATALNALNPGFPPLTVTCYPPQGPLEIADLSGHAKWPKKLPREHEPSEVLQPESGLLIPGVIEVIGHNGLSSYMSKQEFWLRQVIGDSGSPSGNFSPRPLMPSRADLIKLEVRWREGKRDRGC